MRSSSVLLFNASALAIGLVGATPAFAQVSGPPEVVVPAQAEEDARDCDPAALGAEACDNPDNATRNADGSEARGGTITVTGTRIRLPNLESFEPTATVDRRQIQERNFTNVADAINELPGPRGSVTPAGAQGSFGQGVNFVNNYGLGSNRTLTLVNGRRFVTSNVASNFGNATAGTQTDLNVIPAIILDRIDVVGVGGAPVYGSDAIAGVVNVILRTRFDGIEVSALSGITEEGDNFRWNLSALAGWDFGDRANLTVSLSHDEVRGLTYNDRDFLRENIGGVTNPTSAQAGASRFPGVGPGQDLRLNPNIGFNNSTSDFAPGVVQARMVGIPFLTAGGLITNTNLTNASCSNPNDPSSCIGIATNRALRFDPNGNLVPFNQGILFGANTQASGQSDDTFLFNNYSQITSDLNRTIFTGFFTFDLSENVQLFLEGTYFRSRADELVQQPTFNSNLFGGSSGQLTFRTDSPFLTDQARAALTARGVTQFQISRVSSDLADLTGFNRTQIFRGVAGFRGDMNIFGRDWNWEVSANHGETESRDYRQDLNAQNFANAVNVTRNASGAIVCTTAPTRLVGATLTGFAAPGFSPDPDPNCVPFNPLGEGRASQAARDYIIEDTLTISRQRQFVINANLGGTLFDLPGGALGFNVGYEHRREEAKFTPDQFTVQGRGRSVPITPLEGSYTLNEAFGEILIPLVSPEMGIPFLQDARVFARGRYVDSSINGGFFSWAVGGSLAPIRDIEFRGNFTRSFRHPAITELFLPIVPAFSTVPDICSLATRNAGAAPAVRAANCAAFLARYPNSTPDPAASATVPVLTGGNPTLDNEQADSWTAGFILRPRFLPRFSATADYISITLDQPIASLTVAQVASACFDNPDFDTADPANGNAFCSRIHRDATTGRVINDPANPAVQVGFVNGVQIRFRGIQGTMNYSLPVDRWGMNGTFTIGADMVYVKSRLNNITGVAPARSDGILGDPEFAGQLRLRYVEDTWGTNWTINYVGEQLFSRLNRTIGTPGSGPDARELDELDDYVIVNAGIWFDPAEDFRLTLGVNNLFNRQGQEYFGVLHPSSYNDLLGRRFSASARVRF